MTTKSTLPRSTPESQGIPCSAISAFVDAVDQADLGIHSFMLVRHGLVAAEAWWAPYSAESPHMLYSLSKSFTSTAAGIAIGEGNFALDDPVLKFFPDEVPADVSDNLKAMQVRDLLTMSSGHDSDAAAHVRSDPDAKGWLTPILAEPVTHQPGAVFRYNNSATYLVSAIIQRTTGSRLLDFLTPRLFTALGIATPHWEMSPEGIDFGASGLSLLTEDIAKFGLLYLQRGVWNGRRLIPEDWVREATRKQVSNGEGEPSQWNQGYGYQFWRCFDNVYRGDGAFGQFCIVMPESDTVIAMTSGSRDMGAILAAVWEHLRPAMVHAPLPEVETEQTDLLAKLAGLSISAPLGLPSSPVAAEVSGRRYAFNANELELEAISFDFGVDDVGLSIWTGRGIQRIGIGAQSWLCGTTELPDRGPTPSKKVAARGTWTADNTYAATLCFYETPFVFTLVSRFDDHRLTLDLRRNVCFDKTEWPPFEATAT